jgi:hypothetical protein
MGWISERIALLADAYMHRKGLVTVSIAVCAFVGAFDPIKNWIRSAIRSFVSLPPWEPPPKEGAMIFEVPSWEVGCFLLLLVFLYVITEHAVRLKRQLAPKLEIDFVPEGDGITQTPIQLVGKDQNGNLVHLGDSNGCYVRIKLIGKTKIAIRNCVVVITQISRKENIINPKERELNLGTPIYLTPTPIDVYPRVPRYIDFLQTDERGDKLSLSQPPALMIKDEFNTAAIFNFTIAVVGDGVDDEIKISIDWDGRWDGLKGKKLI